MSQENVEIVRRAVEQWQRGGGTPDALPVEIYADDVEWDFSGCLGDVTVARYRLRGHGMGSGASIEHTSWQVTEWRDKKAVWWRVFVSEAEALEAAGLSE